MNRKIITLIEDILILSLAFLAVTFLIGIDIGAFSVGIFDMFNGVGGDIRFADTL